MQLAQQYLHSSNMPLKAIAYQLGYKHASNFNRAFCDYFGAPPETLRRRRQETNANSANLPK
jgi:AraC-like DNA-binding protein